MPAGRPTAYSEELELQAIEYIEKFAMQGEQCTSMPSVVGLCKEIKVAKSTIYDWAKKNVGQFSDIVEQVNELQEFFLINGGLMGDLNPTITKLLLHKHGYHDKADNVHSGPNGGPLEVTTFSNLYGTKNGKPESEPE